MNKQTSKGVIVVKKAKPVSAKAVMVRDLEPDAPLAKADSLQAWEGSDTASSMSLEAMDNLIRAYQKQDAQCAEIDKLSKAAEEAKKELKDKILSALTFAKKDSYKVDGVGTAYKITKFVVKCPQGLTEKNQFFSWIKKNHGNDSLMTLVSINHQTLNSWYNGEAERAKELKKSLVIDGLEAPTSYENIGFRKDAKSKGKE